MKLFSVPPEVEVITSDLQKPIFSLKDLDLTYRAVNHYESKGIVLGRRPNRKSWRKFDSAEFVWIWIITQLRLIGIRLEDISILEKKIFVEGQLGYVDKANFINRSFIQELAFSIHGNYKLYMILYTDMSFTFHDSISLQQWLNNTYKDEVHINIPLQEPIKEIRKEMNLRLH